MRETRRFERKYDVLDLNEAIASFRNRLVADEARLVDIIHWEPEWIETGEYGKDIAQHIANGFRVWAEVSFPVSVCEFCGAKS